MSVQQGSTALISLHDRGVQFLQKKIPSFSFGDKLILYRGICKGVTVRCEGIQDTERKVPHTHTHSEMGTKLGDNGHCSPECSIQGLLAAHWPPVALPR